MNISYDRFIRTTDPYHVSAIQKIFKAMYEKGDIYKGTYEGMYCTPCESFLDGKPAEGREMPGLRPGGAAGPGGGVFLPPVPICRSGAGAADEHRFPGARSRVHEMVNNFIDSGLEDLCVSRTSFTWGFRWTSTRAMWSMSGWTRCLTI